jgi:hypothetical protein
MAGCGSNHVLIQDKQGALADFARTMRAQRCTAQIKSRAKKIRRIFAANL